MKFVPTILLHIFYPDSRKTGFGWWLFIVASLGTFFLHKANGDPKLDASTWLLCVSIAGALIGGGTLADGKLELEAAKVALEAAKAQVPPAPAAAAPAAA